MRLWKRKWFVLADFCLFYYKGLCFFVVNIKLEHCSCSKHVHARVCVCAEEREREMVLMAVMND